MRTSLSVISRAVTRCRRTPRFFCLSKSQINKSWNQSVGTETHARTHLARFCSVSLSMSKIPQIRLPATHNITISLWPVAIDFQALPISDNQTINELCSISRAPAAPGSSAARWVCVCGCSVWVCVSGRVMGCVFLCLCYLIGALRAELQSHIWCRLELIEWPLHTPHTQTLKTVFWISCTPARYSLHTYYRYYLYLFLEFSNVPWSRTSNSKSCWWAGGASPTSTQKSKMAAPHNTIKKAVVIHCLLA